MGVDVVTFGAAKKAAQKMIEGAGAVAGKSAYQIAVDNGFSGTETEWLESLQGADGAPGADGKSAYEIAVENGFEGDEEAWLASLHGADGQDGQDGAPGSDGADGYSPTVVVKTNTSDTYVLTVTYKDANGDVQSYDTPNLKGSGGGGGGSAGADGYSPTVVVKTSSSDTYVLTVTYKDGNGITQSYDTPNLKGADGTNGSDGASAYEIAVENGFSGTEQEWLASLQGADGQDGQDGTDGQDATADFIAPTEASSTASAAYVVGDQLIYNGILYNVIAPIAASDTLTVGSNIAAANNITKQIKDVKSDIGDLNNLSTTAKSSLVAAINEAAQSGGSGSGGGGGTVIAEVTGDGSTTASALLDSLYAQVQAKGGLDEKKNYKLLRYYLSYNSYDVMTLYSFANNEKIEFATFWQGINEICSDNYVLKSSGSTITKQTSKDSNSTTDKSSNILPSGDKYTIIEYGGGAGSGSAGYEVLAESQSGDTYAEALARFSSILSAMSDEEVVNTALINGTNDLSLLTFNERDNNYIQYTSVIGNTTTTAFFKCRISSNGNIGDTFAKYVSHPDNGTTPSVTDLSSTTVTSLKLVRLAGSSSSSGASSEEIGDLEDLTTSTKTDLVSAINEVNNLANGEEVVLATAGSGTYAEELNSFYTVLETLPEEQLTSTYLSFNGEIIRFVYKYKDSTPHFYTYADISGYSSSKGMTFTRFYITANSGSAINTASISSTNAVTTSAFSGNNTNDLKLCLKASQTKMPTGAIEVSKVTSGTIGAAIDSFYDLIDLDETPLWYIFIRIPTVFTVLMPYIGGAYKFASSNFNNIASSASGNEYLRKALCTSSNSKFYESTSESTWEYSSTTIPSDGYVSLYKVANVSGSSSQETVVDSFAGDGIKTMRQCFNSMYTKAISANLTPNSYLKQTSTQTNGAMYYKLISTWNGELVFQKPFNSSTGSRVIRITANDSTYYDYGDTTTNYSDDIMSVNEKFELIL